MLLTACPHISRLSGVSPDSAHCRHTRQRHEKCGNTVEGISAGFSTQIMILNLFMQRVAINAKTSCRACLNTLTLTQYLQD